MNEIKNIYKIIHKMNLNNIIENNKNLIILTDKYYENKSKEIVKSYEDITKLQLGIRSLEKKNKLYNKYTMSLVQRIFPIFNYEGKINESSKILNDLIIETKTKKNILNHHLKKIEKFQKNKIQSLIDEELNKNLEYKKLKEKIKEIEEDSLYTYNIPKLNNLINQIKKLKESLSNFEEIYEDLIDNFQSENEFDKKIDSIFLKIKTKIDRLNNNVDKIYLKHVYNFKINNNIKVDNINQLIFNLDKMKNRFEKDLNSLINEKEMRVNKYKYAINEMKSDLYEKIGL